MQRTKSGLTLEEVELLIEHRLNKLILNIENYTKEEIKKELIQIQTILLKSW